MKHKLVLLTVVLLFMGQYAFAAGVLSESAQHFFNWGYAGFMHVNPQTGNAYYPALDCCGALLMAFFVIRRRFSFNLSGYRRFKDNTQFYTVSLLTVVGISCGLILLVGLPGLEKGWLFAVILIAGCMCSILGFIMAFERDSHTKDALLFGISASWMVMVTLRTNSWVPIALYVGVAVLSRLLSKKARRVSPPPHYGSMFVNGS